MSSVSYDSLSSAAAIIPQAKRKRHFVIVLNPWNRVDDTTSELTDLISRSKNKKLPYLEPHQAQKPKQSATKQ